MSGRSYMGYLENMAYSQAAVGDSMSFTVRTCFSYTGEAPAEVTNYTVRACFSYADETPAEVTNYTARSCFTVRHCFSYLDGSGR